MIQQPHLVGDALAELTRYDSQFATLEKCEREPIHYIGHVQAHGVLVGATLEGGEYVIRYLSENIEEHLGLATAKLLSKAS